MIMNLMGLPAELRLEIFNWVFRSIKADVERWNLHDSQDILSPLPETPLEVCDLKLVCRTFAREIDDKWHSEVTYWFPSAVAFMDVLSQWPASKVQTLRHAHVTDFCMVIEPYHSRGQGYLWLANGLPVFEGLQLDTLIVETMLNAGDLSLVNPMFDVLWGLLRSKGWKEVYYLFHASGIGNANRRRRLIAEFEEYRLNQNEPDMKFAFYRAHLPECAHNCPEEGLFDDPDDSEEELENPQEAAEEDRQWYADLPECYFPYKCPVDASGDDIFLWIQRGKKSNCKQDGTPKEEWIEELLADKDWIELRWSGQPCQDGLDDPLSVL